MASTGKVLWTGRVLSGLASALLLMSALMKLRGGPELAAGFEHLGLPLTMAWPLGLLELTCVVVYLVPPTAVLGAVLLTGYMGGAICTHWRVGDPFGVQIGLGLVLWLGLYLRDGRLHALLPLRRP
jgi:hypothetical protein